MDTLIHDESADGTEVEVEEWEEVKITADQIDYLQGYFEETVRKLTQKAMSGTDAVCRPI